MAFSTSSRETRLDNDGRIASVVGWYDSSTLDAEILMPQYLIERNIPGAGKLSPAELQAISQKSCSVLNTLGPSIQWVHSYVTDDQIHCIYRAPNEAMVREHAKQGGFPADRVSEIRTVIDPTTAE
ncbi:hypothetical protein BH11GEM1_BH11GEM1_03710 [soil metagenome]